MHSRNGRACPQQQKAAATEAPTPAAGASTAAVAPAAAAEAGTGGVVAELAEACSPRRQRLTPHAVRLHLRVAQHEQPPPETESEPEPAELTHRPAPQVGLALRSAILSARFAGRLHAASKREQLRATRSLESFKKTTIDMINLMRAASAAPGERSAKARRPVTLSEDRLPSRPVRLSGRALTPLSAPQGRSSALGGAARVGGAAQGVLEGGDRGDRAGGRVYSGRYGRPAHP